MKQWGLDSGTVDAMETVVCAMPVASFGEGARQRWRPARGRYAMPGGHRADEDLRVRPP